MRLGIIGSSGGSALASAVACLKDADKPIDIAIATDRECGLLDWARSAGYASILLPYLDGPTFSQGCLRYFKAQDVRCVLLFFTRRVTKPLLGSMPVFNIHPSLLPAFPGLHGVTDAMEAKVRILGATLHIATESIDAGPILAQIASGLPFVDNGVSANKISYLQKIYLTLVCYELLRDFAMTVEIATNSVTFHGTPNNSFSASPCLQDPSLIGAFDRLQERERCRILT